MKRRSVILRALMRRRTELESRKARKQQPNPKRSRILTRKATNPLGMVAGFLAAIMGGRRTA